MSYILVFFDKRKTVKKNVKYNVIKYKKNNIFLVRNRTFSNQNEMKGNVGGYKKEAHQKNHKAVNKKGLQSNEIR